LNRRCEKVLAMKFALPALFSWTLFTACVAEVVSAAEPILAPGGKPELLSETGAGEGPAWHPELGLLTSGDGHVMRRDLQGKQSIYREQAGTNGLLFDRLGRLVMCEPVRRRVSRLEPNGQVTVLTDNYRGKRYNQPNDLTIDSKNRIYFSDPCYGDRSHLEVLDDQGKQVEGVYRIDPDGSVTRIITHEVDRPNGLVVTADDKFLFVADNNNDTVGGARKLFRFLLKPDGTVDIASQKLIHDWKQTRGPDGMKLDSLGRLYVAGGLNRQNPPYETQDQPTAGVYVFSPEGELLQFIAIPRDETTNCAFGGPDLKTLYVTAGGSLWKIPLAVAGRPAWPPLR
jgi:gluconolactonase